MLVKCDSCGWVHIAVSCVEMQESVRNFNEAYAHLTEEQQQEYYNSKPARMADYMTCSRCGKSYKQMSLVEETDTKTFKRIDGKTLQPVLWK